MAKRKLIDSICENCSKPFGALAFSVAKGYGRFCSRKCMGDSQRIPLAVRFPKYIGPITDRGCKVWTGRTQQHGYGVINSSTHNGCRGPVLLAHRVAYALVHGPIPDGMFVCHHCDNPPCVNVDHLFLGDHQANMDDRLAKGHYFVKLTAGTVASLRGKYATGLFSIKNLADEFGIDPSYTSKILRGIYWPVS